jgi:2-polyprenyl-3-methyl-5-hydroxy-6-metoxy-1,4-benzoquinol methylase
MIGKMELVGELARSPAKDMTGLGALKTRYRPVICPLERVLDEIPTGSRLFDIGCGSGSLMYLAIRLRQVELAHGYDVSLPAVRSAELFARSSPGFRVAHLAAEQTPPRLNGYDVITMVDVLHHISPALQGRFLATLAEAMDPGARLIVLDINPEKKVRAFCNQMHDLLLSREWVHPMAPAPVVDLLTQSGIEIDSQRLINTLWYSHFLIVGQKSTQRH